ncbi:hypothetical protein SVAN01_02614 [Stagonosporopsis vannaccii]|nr:hypothetical protein SVAN01_02614 [Stagonosporopsis vannaccii]
MLISKDGVRQGETTTDKICIKRAIVMQSLACLQIAAETHSAQRVSQSQVELQQVHLEAGRWICSGNETLYRSLVSEDTWLVKDDAVSYDNTALEAKFGFKNTAAQQQTQLWRIIDALGGNGWQIILRP